MKEYKLLSNEQGMYYSQKKSYNNECYIVGGGPSLKDFDFKKLENKTTIAVNKSILNVPNSNYFITTDYTFLNYLRKNNQYEQFQNSNAIKVFVANCISDQLQIIDGNVVDTKFNLEYELQDFDRIIICKSAKSIGFNHKDFNSGYNSGFCALQLAVILGYNPIYLLGIDMNSEGNNTHYHGGYGKNLARMNQNLENYSTHFLSILTRLKIDKPQLNIFSCSERSLLNNVIEYKNFEDIK